MRQILDWNRLTNEITHAWIKDYFEIDDDEANFDWVCDEVGGIFEFADYFISFNNVLDCYKYNVTKEQFLTWYYFCLENQSVTISLAKYLQK